MISMTSSSSAENLIALATITEFDGWAAVADPTNGSAAIRAPCKDPAILFLARRVRLDFAISSEELEEPAGNQRTSFDATAETTLRPHRSPDSFYQTFQFSTRDRVSKTALFLEIP